MDDVVYRQQQEGVGFVSPGRCPVTQVERVPIKLLKGRIDLNDKSRKNANYCTRGAVVALTVD